MDHEYLLPCLDFRQCYLYHSVEPSGPGQSWVQNVLPVGSCKHNHCLTAWKPIHLHKHLIQGWVLLFVSGCLPLLADRVNLVNEYDRWCLGSSPCEKLSHSWSTQAYEHLYELRTWHIEERSSSLSSTGFGKHRFPCAWRPGKQGPLWDLGTHFYVLVTFL